MIRLYIVIDTLIIKPACLVITDTPQFYSCTLLEDYTYPHRRRHTLALLSADSIRGKHFAYSTCQHHNINSNCSVVVGQRRLNVLLTEKLRDNNKRQNCFLCRFLANLVFHRINVLHPSSHAHYI